MSFGNWHVYACAHCVPGWGGLVLDQGADGPLSCPRRHPGCPDHQGGHRACFFSQATRHGQQLFRWDQVSRTLDENRSNFPPTNMCIPAIGGPSKKDWFTSGGEGWRHHRRGSWKKRRKATETLSERGEEGSVCRRPPGLFILTVVWQRRWKKESGLRRRRPPAFVTFASHSVWGLGSRSQVSSGKAGLCLLVSGLCLLQQNAVLLCSQQVHSYICQSLWSAQFQRACALCTLLRDRLQWFANDCVHWADFWDVVCRWLMVWEPPSPLLGQSCHFCSVHEHVTSRS